MSLPSVSGRWTIWVQSRSHFFWLMVGFGMLLGAGWLDYATGTEINVTLFYFIPVGLVAWFVGPRSGSVLAVLGAVIWYLSDVWAGHRYSQYHIAVWDTLVSFIFFLLADLVIARFRIFVDREQELGRVDFLTGLPNRRGFFELAHREVARCKRQGLPLTLAYIDCDRFKSVNDRWGHQAGDELLSLIGDILKRSLRSTDIAARIGGDEFAILLPDLQPSHADETLRVLHQKLRQGLRSKPWDIDFSIGVISHSRINQEVEEMLIQADALMYRVKRGPHTSQEPRILSGIS